MSGAVPPLPSVCLYSTLNYLNIGAHNTRYYIDAVLLINIFSEKRICLPTVDAVGHHVPTNQIREFLSFSAYIAP